MQTKFNTPIFEPSTSAPAFVPKDLHKAPPTSVHDNKQNEAPLTNISPQEISHDLEKLPPVFFLPSNLFDDDDGYSSHLPDLSDKSPEINTGLSSDDPSLLSGQSTGLGFTYIDICNIILKSKFFKMGLAELQTAEALYINTCTQLEVHQKKVIEDLTLTYDEECKVHRKILSKKNTKALREYREQMIKHHMEQADLIGIKFVSCHDENSLLVEQYSLKSQAFNKKCRPLFSIGDLFKRLKEETSGIIDTSQVSTLELFQEVQSETQNDTLTHLINNIDFSINQCIIFYKTENIPGFIEHSLHTIRQFNKALLSFYQLDNYSINENDLLSAWANDVFKTFDSYFSQIKTAEYEAKKKTAELVYKTSTQAALENYNERTTYLVECYNKSLSYLRAYIQQLATSVATQILNSCKQSFLHVGNYINQEIIYQLLSEKLTCNQFISLIRCNSPRNSPKIAPLTEPLLSNLFAFAEITQNRIQSSSKKKQLDIISSCSSTMFRAPAATQDDFESRTKSPTCNT